MSDQTPWPVTLGFLPTDQLFVDHTYQRELSTLAEAIGADFQHNLFGAVTVSTRVNTRGKITGYAIIDGQTRWKGASENGEAEVPCVIHVGLTVPQEAGIFRAIQVQRRNLSSWERFNAAVVEGVDAARSRIAKTVQKERFKLGNPSEYRKNARVISAVAALEFVYAKGAGANVRTLEGGDPGLGVEYLRQTLRVIREGFPSQPNGYISARMLRGMGSYVTREFAEPLDEARLIDAFKKRTPADIFAFAHELASGVGDPGGKAHQYTADAINRIYILG